MEKAEFLETIGELVRLQEYQSYKGRAFKGCIKRQAKLIARIGKACDFHIYPCDVAECFKVLDVAPQFVRLALGFDE